MLVRPYHEVVLDGESLTLEALVAVARDAAAVRVAEPALERMRAAREVVEAALAGDVPVYGMTTGVGERKRVRLEPDERERFQRVLLGQHRIAQGEPAPPDVVRATMTCLVNGFAKGTVGVRPALAELVAGALNDGFAPRVRRLGSLGQADLGPLADLAHELLARTRFAIVPNEGHALVASNAFATGWGALALWDAGRLLDTFDVAGALDLEAYAANFSALHPVVAETRPHAGLRATLARLHALLVGSPLWDTGTARALQDPLTFRCLPQLHGAARDALAYARGQVEAELNASQGNPVVSLGEQRMISVGNFDVVALAAALDFARIALAPVITAAAERALKLLQPAHSGLPAALAARHGLAESALQELGIVAQALAVEARTLAAPVSYELVSTTQSSGLEDRATMAPLSARRLDDLVALGARVAALELAIATQALDLRAPAAVGAGPAEAARRVRALVPFLDAGDPLPPDFDALVGLVRAGGLELALPPAVSDAA